MQVLVVQRVAKRSGTERTRRAWIIVSRDHTRFVYVPSTATVAVANPVTATSLASTATTGKSPLEHATSAATKKDCSFINALVAKPICVDIPIPAITDNSSPLLGPADFVIQPVKQ